MTDKFTIKKINKKNFNYFFELLQAFARQEKMNIPNELLKKKIMKDALSKKPKFFVNLAKLNDEYIGYISYYLTYSSTMATDILHGEDFYIKPKYRKLGYGKILFDSYILKSKKLGCCRAEWIVLDWNKSAIRFYDNYGAKKLNWYVYKIDKNTIEKKFKK